MPNLIAPDAEADEFRRIVKMTRLESTFSDTMQWAAMMCEISAYHLSKVVALRDAESDSTRRAELTAMIEHVRDGGYADVATLSMIDLDGGELPPWPEPVRE